MAHLNNRFGRSVAIENGRIAVGAYVAAGGAEPGPNGQVIIYEPNASSTHWHQTRTVLPDSEDRWTEQFGRAIAIDGDTIISSAHRGLESEGRPGRAYIWTEASEREPVEETNYAHWARNHFGFAAVADQSLEGDLWGLEADPDQDGSSNMLEYYFMLNPLCADEPIIRASIVSA